MQNLFITRIEVINNESNTNNVGSGNSKSNIASGSSLISTPASIPVGHSEKPEKFNGKDFKIWQQKMLFYLTTLNLEKYLREEAPSLGEDPDRQSVVAIDAWKHSDFLCKNYILNGLDNALYNVYIPTPNAKILCESLDKKYKTEDAGSKKFIVGKFLDFLMDSPFDLVAYSDSDYAGASLDRKSTTGGCQFLGCKLIYWQCKKQTVVATSSTEAAYVAAASGCAQVLWIQNQLLDYGILGFELTMQVALRGIWSLKLLS
uniref:Uncharacterized protein n=1 Tax=Tanacetum cinerariifolium TaxID=118510 RepID=A0A699HSI6_TANCI|nr:uncharacterized protein [Tanacetum cinerariifolium]